MYKKDRKTELVCAQLQKSHIMICFSLGLGLVEKKMLVWEAFEGQDKEEEGISFSIAYQIYDLPKLHIRPWYFHYFLLIFNFKD